MMKISLNIPFCILLLVTLSEPKALQKGTKHLNSISHSETLLQRGDRGLTSSEWHMQPRSNKIEEKGIWGSWSSWSVCSVTCGDFGTRKRTRKCINKGKSVDSCSEDLIELEKCDTIPCNSGDFGKTKVPVESPITTKIPALLNDSTSTDPTTEAEDTSIITTSDSDQDQSTERTCPLETWHYVRSSHTATGCSGFTSDHCFSLNNESTSEDVQLRRNLIDVVLSVPSVSGCQKLCQQQMDSTRGCEYFVYDKKNCNCKLYEFNDVSFLEEYNDGCRKLGGTKFPSLATCPAFMEDFNTCYNFREGRCRYQGHLLEHLDNCKNAEVCQTACRVLTKCEYFNYDMQLKDCELITSTSRNCDLVRGPPEPDYDECLENGNILWV